MAVAQPHGDESALVLAVQRGDGDAFAELYRRHYPAVQRACCRRLSDPVEADEVAQAAFVRAFERIDQCAGDRRFGPWIHVIARSLCMDAFRAQARVEPRDELPAGGTEPRPSDPEESVLRRERAAQMQEALASLPDRQRRAVIARDWDELRPGEIADHLGLSVGAVDSLLLRARRRLALAYRRVAGEGGGGATVLPVRSTAAAIVVAVAAAPQAVMAGTAAAAQAVQDGATRAGGAVAAVVSLAVGVAGSDHAPPPPPPAVVTTVAAVAEQPLARLLPPAATYESTPTPAPLPGPAPAAPAYAPEVERAEEAAALVAPPAPPTQPTPVAATATDAPDARRAPVPAAAAPEVTPPVAARPPADPPVATNDELDAPPPAVAPAEPAPESEGKGKGKGGRKGDDEAGSPPPAAPVEHPSWPVVAGALLPTGAAPG